MDPEQYLDRIGLDSGDVRSVNSATLDRLQHAHVRSVPFENLSIVGDPHGDYLGEGIPLSLPDLYRKLVERERGGLCFELNSLFAWLLEELGFDVSRLAGRVYTASDGQLSALASHLTLLVSLDTNYVADVGFGDIIRRPLPLAGGPRRIVDGDWRVVESKRDDAEYEVEYRPPDDEEWTPRYVYVDTPRQMDFFEDARAYHECDPAAPFTGDPVVSVATPRGRKTLSWDSLTITEDGEKRKRSVEPTEWHDVLEREFGVVLSEK